jgi:hypothetical protein
VSAKSIRQSRKDVLVKVICEQLGSPQQRTNIACEVRRQLELWVKLDSKLAASIKNAKALSKSAREFRELFGTFRAKGQKDKFADLLKATFAGGRFETPDGAGEGIGPFEIIDSQLEWLTHIAGPDVRFDTTKRLAAEAAAALTRQFSQRPMTLDQLLTLAPPVYEFMTGELLHGDLERACRAVLAVDHAVARAKARKS